MTKRAMGQPSEPLVLYIVFVAVAAGTVTLSHSLRLVVLWTAMVALAVWHWSREGVELDLEGPLLARGALLGLVVSVPPLAFLSGTLQTFSEGLQASQDVALLFYQVCWVSAPAEEAFFRGVLWPDQGSATTLALYAAAILLMFVPHVPILAALIATVAMSVLGLVFGYVRERYGLGAAIAAHTSAGFVLQVAPSIIDGLRTLLI